MSSNVTILWLRNFLALRIALRSYENVIIPSSFAIWKQNEFHTVYLPADRLTARLIRTAIDWGRSPTTSPTMPVVGDMRIVNRLAQFPARRSVSVLFTDSWVYLYIQYTEVCARFHSHDNMLCVDPAGCFLEENQPACTLHCLMAAAAAAAANQNKSAKLSLCLEQMIILASCSSL